VEVTEIGEERTLARPRWETRTPSTQAINQLFDQDFQSSQFYGAVSKVVHSGERVVLNTVESADAHVPPMQHHVKMFTAIPLRSGDEMVGIIGLANRSEGYPDFLFTWLAPLFQIAGRVINEIKLNRVRQEVENQRKERDKANAANQ